MLVVHYWTPGWATGTAGSDAFWVTPEDEIDVLNKYYGVPSVSFRNTFYHLMKAQVRVRGCVWVRGWVGG